MSLRPPPAMPPALLAANRRQAQRPSGPRTTRGNVQARLNGLGPGPRARFNTDGRKGILIATFKVRMLLKTKGGFRTRPRCY